MSIFCKHKWVKISEIVNESALEQLRKTGLTTESFNISLSAKPYVVIVSCEKCGKIKEFKGVLR